MSLDLGARVEHHYFVELILVIFTMNLNIDRMLLLNLTIELIHLSDTRLHNINRLVSPIQDRESAVYNQLSFGVVGKGIKTFCYGSGVYFFDEYAHV